MVETNLRVIRRNRHMPEAGDLFALCVGEATYLCGSVLRARPERTHAPMPGALLVVIFNGIFSSLDSVSAPPSDTAAVLLPPMWTNRQPWTRGYFVPIGTRGEPFAEIEHLARFYSGARQKWVDINGNSVRPPRPSQLQGIWALASYRAVDDEISDALGVPRAPDGDAPPAPA